MNILITDSGVGGLSVCAYAERSLRSHGFDEPVELTYVNASPENDFGYNSMESREEKLRYFDRFLRIITDRFTPDSIYVACNTLSVLLEDTPYFADASIPVRGIVATGVGLLAEALIRDRARAAVIFGTVTTIEARTYPRLLMERGIEASRIISQACPGLADTISEDREGLAASAEITKWVRAASERLGPESLALAYLGCTHYGYRKELFAEAFDSLGIPAEVLDPNERAVDDLFGSHEPSAESHGRSRDVNVQFVTRYRIPETALEALSDFLGEISPKTVEALRNYHHIPDLF